MSKARREAIERRRAEARKAILAYLETRPRGTHIYDIVRNAGTPYGSASPIWGLLRALEEEGVVRSFPKPADAPGHGNLLFWGLARGER